MGEGANDMGSHRRGNDMKRRCGSGSLYKVEKWEPHHFSTLLFSFSCFSCGSHFLFLRGEPEPERGGGDAFVLFVLFTQLGGMPVLVNEGSVEPFCVALIQPLW